MFDEFDTLAAWMRNEGVNSLFVYDWNWCEWSSLEGNYSCLIGEAPSILLETWNFALEHFHAASVSILKEKYPDYTDWETCIMVDSLKFAIDCNGWNALVSVWIENGKESRSFVGELGARDLVSIQGHIRWSSSEKKSWVAKIDASTHVQPGALGSLT
ncbi:hypothetical protein HF673_01110 [Acidithiobacillus thiooxidans]|uniref:hypothetical protein n=1 Tax=Acidithiobacillus thiooxidans TaxID=930 RepID=UPI001C0693E0|nr:hypothetical protein [Acidithiobacillus thiooxidans]MBU2834414.1 hypothetical protein [Acidithiobacillus thiooxidans]